MFPSLWTRVANASFNCLTLTNKKTGKGWSDWNFCHRQNKMEVCAQRKTNLLNDSYEMYFDQGQT